MIVLVLRLISNPVITGAIVSAVYADAMRPEALDTAVIALPDISVMNELENEITDEACDLKSPVVALIALRSAVPINRRMVSPFELVVVDADVNVRETGPDVEICTFKFPTNRLEDRTVSENVNTICPRFILTLKDVSVGETESPVTCKGCNGDADGISFTLLPTISVAVALIIDTNVFDVAVAIG